MSGHSKWSSIKHKKAAVDAKRGKLFTRLLREIFIAARMGGADTDSNSRLRAAVQAAKDANMPGSNMEKAIRKGTGELSGVSFEDFAYEGYGPSGVALMAEGSTDNHNRTAPEIRFIFNKYGGNLGEIGCVAWMFSKKGVILLSAEGQDEDAVMECALEAGAEDVVTEGDMIHVTTAPDEMAAVREALEASGLKVESASLERIPQNTVHVEGKDAAKVLKLLSALEDHEEVSRVAANFEIDAELIEQLTQ